MVLFAWHPRDLAEGSLGGDILGAALHLHFVSQGKGPRARKVSRRLSSPCPLTLEVGTPPSPHCFHIPGDRAKWCSGPHSSPGQSTRGGGTGIERGSQRETERQRERKETPWGDGVLPVHWCPRLSGKRNLILRTSPVSKRMSPEQGDPGGTWCEWKRSLEHLLLCVAGGVGLSTPGSARGSGHPRHHSMGERDWEDGGSPRCGHRYVELPSECGPASSGCAPCSSSGSRRWVQLSQKPVSDQRAM